MGNVLKFGQSIRGDWDLFADVMGRSCGLTVGLSWSLTWASLINGPVMAGKLKDVPLKSKAALDAFLASPADGKKMKALLAAEVMELMGIRTQVPVAPVSVGGFVLMAFDDDDEVDVPASAESPAAAALAAVVVAEAKVMAMSFPDGEEHPPRKVLKRLEKELETTPTIWKDALTALSAVDAPAAAAYVQMPVVSHIRNLKRKLKAAQNL